MGILSSNISVTRYRVEGRLEEPVMETVASGLKSQTIQDIDGEPLEHSAGWTSFEKPFAPDFSGSSFSLATYFLFSLRIDKKSIPSKVVQKLYTIEAAKQLTETGRSHLARNEKKMIRDKVVENLSLRIPATPHIYDLIWSYEESLVWFFSTQKTANEELETLFGKSFKLHLIRLFPYTVADLTFGLSDSQRDVLSKLMPAHFSE